MRKGTEAGELSASVPLLERGELTVEELRLNMRSTVRVHGRPIPIASARCSGEDTGEVHAEAACIDGASPIVATTEPTCAS